MKPQIIASPTEQTTAGTDAVIALMGIASAAAVRARREGDPYRADLWTGAFTMLALSGALGAIAHGFEMSEQTNRNIWRPLNATLGATVALFAVGAIRDRWGEPAARKALPLWMGGAATFVGVTQVIPGSFAVFLAFEAIAMLLSLGVYADLSRKGTLPGAKNILAGVLLTIAAAGVQASPLKAMIFGMKFDNNGLFHLVQMAALPQLVKGINAGLSTDA